MSEFFLKREKLKKTCLKTKFLQIQILNLTWFNNRVIQWNLCFDVLTINNSEMACKKDALGRITVYNRFFQVAVLKF